MNETNKINVFYGQASIGGSPTYTWMCGKNRACYDVTNMSSWMSQEQAIGWAKSIVGPGGEIDVYKQGGQFQEKIVVEGQRQKHSTFGSVKSSGDGSAIV